ncbi:MAG: hypothetical protein MUF01_10140 [Bryobacterales bacterium]|nr:hypothetical protein [Bryobacterales bacterium]
MIERLAFGLMGNQHPKPNNTLAGDNNQPLPGGTRQPLPDDSVGALRAMSGNARAR